MKVLIIEDELPAAKRLKKLLAEIDANIEFVGHLQEVEETVKWLKTENHPDLIFMDIQLADGYSFEIFEKVEITSQVIFATAFDQFAIKAFKVNGLDYLLKPIDKHELVDSLERFRSIKERETLDVNAIREFFNEQKRSFKDRFLVKSGDQLNYVKVEEIAYFTSEESYSFLVTKKGNQYILDDTLDRIIDCLNPDNFYRVNRKRIISIDAIRSIHPYFNNRLKIELIPNDKEETIVSRPRVKDFKEWLNH